VKKRGLVIKPQSTPNGEINITPLVDVVLVLLIIFMVVTPLLEKDIGVQLPSIEKQEAVQELPIEQLIVKIAADGKMELNGSAIDDASLVGTLQEKLKTRTDKTVFIIASDDANYSRLVAALDGAKAAGAQVLGMATDAPGAQ
jgi:biopolymer transport protein TolR